MMDLFVFEDSIEVCMRRASARVIKDWMFRKPVVCTILEDIVVCGNEIGVP
jgi:hypothetical protein